MAIDSITVQFYLYQDAWIFLPDLIDLAYYVEDDVIEIVQFRPGDLGWSNVRQPDDTQAPIEITLPVGVRTDGFWLEAHNSGPCPAWHDAATEPTWLFLDELIIH
jgi:hypothetical protein